MVAVATARRGGDVVETFTVLTVDANAVAATVHARMPLLLAADVWAHWLDPGERRVEALAPLVHTPPEAWIQARRVGPRVNSVRNDDAALLDPAT